jgi:flavodoxin
MPMKAAVAYYSGHHGNTKKLPDAMKECGDIELIDVTERKEADLSGYDLIGFASGTYFGKFSEAVLDFAKKNLPNQKRVFLINTYRLKSALINDMKRVIEEKSCRLLGIYGCRGFDTFGPLKLFGGIAKGHPDEKDIKGAVEFFTRIVQS